MMLLSLLVAALVPAASAAACQTKCGGVDIPYPFGIGRGCYLETEDSEQDFEVRCSNRTAEGVLRPAPTPMAYDFDVLSIDVLRGKMRVQSPVSSWCYDAASRSMGRRTVWRYDASALRVSDADNRLTVVGCNASAYVSTMWDGAGENGYVVGCHAVCSGGARSLAAAGGDDGSCNSTGGCCQAPIPPGIRSYRVDFNDYDISGVASFSPCSYAMLAEAAAFQFRKAYVTTSELVDTAGGQVPVVLEWSVGRQRCAEAQRNKTGYACVSEHSECLDSKNGPGYLCNCASGYRGNPYRHGPEGCQDINECEDKAKHPCSAHSICRNTPGSFKCYDLILIGISIGVVVVAVVLSCTYAFQEKRRLAAIKRRHFKQHGGFLLFEEMKSRQGQQGGLSFTLFTKAELEEATNRFDERHVLGKGGNGTVYRGDLQDGRAVAIKRCRLVDDERQRREFGKEVLILSQVNHRHVVKLYGCCLEVEVPMLVYQFIPNGTLYQLLHRDPPPPLALRLKVAHEAAEALAYLHSMASPPIIHGDVKSPNILLGEGFAAKVSDFGAAALAPADEAHLVTLVQGTCGYLDPEYMQTCRLTDKSDVYSFGVVLLELLTRRKALALAAPEGERSLAAYFLTAVRDGRLGALLDPIVVEGEASGEVVEMVATLAKRCLEISGEKRPAMREVAEELGRARKL